MLNVWVSLDETGYDVRSWSVSYYMVDRESAEHLYHDALRLMRKGATEDRALYCAYNAMIQADQDVTPYTVGGTPTSRAEIARDTAYFAKVGGDVTPEEIEILRSSTLVLD